MSARRCNARLPVPLEVVEHLRTRLERVGDHPGAVLVRRSPASPVQFVGARRRPVRRGHDAEPVVASVPRGVQALERRHHVVDRPRVAHRRSADLVGEVGRQAFQEPLVRLVHVDVLVAAHEPERRAHADVLVGVERRRAPEVGHAGTAVVHVDRRRLPALQGVDEPPEHADVQVLLFDVAGGRLDEDVGALEDELVQAGADRELGVVVAVHEPGHHEVPGRAEDAVERTASLEVLARSRRHDRRALDDQRPVRDERLLPERDDRVPEDERASPGGRERHVRRPLRWGRPSGPARGGTRRSPRSSTLPSSIVVNSRSR